MINTQNLTTEEQMKINMLAGSFMSGFFRTSGMILGITGTAIKTATSFTAGVLTKTAEVIDSTGEVGGEFLIGLGEKSNQKADEYDDAVKLCEKILSNKSKLDTELIA